MGGCAANMPGHICRDCTHRMALFVPNRLARYLQGGRSSALGGAGYTEEGACDVEHQAGLGTGNSQNMEVVDTTQTSRGRQGQGRGQGQGINAPRRGMGQMTLSEFCSSEGIELRLAIARLRDKGIVAQGKMTIREIADEAGAHPRELRDILGLEGDCDHENDNTTPPR